MITELQWLIKMLTKEKLSANLKDLFIERIGEVEACLSRPTPQRPLPIQTGQAPSTQRLLDEMAQQTGSSVPNMIPGPSVIAQTASAAQALESRQLAIKQAASGKPEPGRTSPRKF